MALSHGKGWPYALMITGFCAWLFGTTTGNGILIGVGDVVIGVTLIVILWQAWATWQRERKQRGTVKAFTALIREWQRLDLQDSGTLGEVKTKLGAAVDWERKALVEIRLRAGAVVEENARILCYIPMDVEIPYVVLPASDSVPPHYLITEEVGKTREQASRIKDWLVEYIGLSMGKS